MLNIKAETKPDKDSFKSKGRDILSELEFQFYSSSPKSSMSYKSFLCNIDHVIEGVAFEQEIWILRGVSSSSFPKHDF